MFNYIHPQDPSLLLTQQEDQMLDLVDNFPYSQLKGYASLADLHAKLTVVVEEEAPERTRTVTYHRSDIERRLGEVKLLLKDPQKCENELLWKLRRKLENILERMGDSDTLTEEQTMTVFGEYIRHNPGDDPVVKLYIGSIRKAAPYREDWLLAQVYVHEMHHAYYDHDHSVANAYIKEVEEPLTELGMLLFMKAFDEEERGIINDALWSVKQKQRGMTSCYGFGAFVYEDRVWRKRDWRKALYDAKYDIDDTTRLMSAYQAPFLQGFYPTDEAHWAEMLWRILHPATPDNGAPSDRLMSFYVAGMMYKDPTGVTRAYDLKRLSVGDTLSVVADSGNRYDINAVLLYAADGRQLGYIPRDVNPVPAALLRYGCTLTAVITEIDAKGNYKDNKVKVDLHGPLPLGTGPAAPVWRPLAASDPDKFAIWGEIAPDTRYLSKLASKDKAEVHFLLPNAHYVVQVNNDEFQRGDVFADDSYESLRTVFGSLVDAPANYGGVFDRASHTIKGGKWAFISYGFSAADFVYDEMRVNPHGVYVALKNGQLGVVDSSNHFYPCNNPDVVCEICDGVLIARDPQLANNDKAIVDTEGHIISRFYECFWAPAANGYMTVCQLTSLNERYGFVDCKTGQEVIAPHYKAADKFKRAKSVDGKTCYRAKVTTFSNEEFYIDERGNRLPD